MMRYAIMAGLLLGMVSPACAGCDVNPVPPGPAGGTGGYWPTPVVTGGTVSTGGAMATGGVVGTGGAPSEAQLVCRHLKDLGCPEGSRPTCAQEIENIAGLGDRASLDTECLLLAGTVDRVRACGSVACGGFQ